MRAGAKEEEGISGFVLSPGALKHFNYHTAVNICTHQAPIETSLAAIPPHTDHVLGYLQKHQNK